MEKADLLFTDPPYGVSYSELARNYGGKEWKNIKGDELRGKALEVFLDKFITAALGVLKEEHTLYICFGSRRVHHLLNVLESKRIYFPVPLVWFKGHANISWARYHPDYELVIFGKPGLEAFDIDNRFIVFCGEGAHPTGKKSIWQGPNNETTTWEIPTDSSVEYVHPTQKPVELVGRALRNSTKRGDIVLDVFGGSGSTLIACEQMGRPCRIMELEPGYCDVMIKRWENMTGKKAMKA